VHPQRFSGRALPVAGLSQNDANKHPSLSIDLLLRMIRNNVSSMQLKGLEQI
jgi:hypothetical protein